MERKTDAKCQKLMEAAKSRLRRILIGYVPPLVKEDAEKIVNETFAEAE